MTRKTPSQRPLRRLLWLRKPRHMRALIIACLFVEKGWSREAIAQYLGIGYSTTTSYLNRFPEFEYDKEDYLNMLEVIDEMKSPLYVTNW